MQSNWIEWIRNLFSNQQINPLNEAGYRTLLENIPVITYINALEKPNHTLYISPQVESLLGYPREAYLHDPTLRVKRMHPDDLERVIHASDRANITRAPFHEEYRLVARDGQTVWVHDEAVVVHDAAGHPQYWLGVWTDIHERKKIEAAGLSNEERYRSFISQSSEGIRRYDLHEPIPIDLPEDEQLARMLKEMYIAECNDAFAHMYGLEKADNLLGKHLSEMGLESNPKNLEALRSFIRARYKVHDIESFERDAQGRERVFLINTIGIVEQGCLQRVWGTQRDITERKKSEAALLQREAMLEALTFVAERFLSVSDWRQNIGMLLERLGKAISASHVYIFEHRTEGAVQTKSMRYEWVAPGQTPDIDKAIYQNTPVRNPNFETSYRLLVNGQPFIGDRAHLTINDQAFLLGRDLKALIEMPIFVDNIWWGTIGFDDMVTEREWSTAELDLLKVAANIVTAAIQRTYAEDSLRTRETILSAMTFAAELFFTEPDWRRNIDVVLERLGRGLNVSHAYIFEHWGDGDERRSSLRYEWTAQGQKPDLGDSKYLDIPVRHPDGDYSYDILQSGQTFIGDHLHVNSEILEELNLRGLKAVLETPIITAGRWWGTIGLDDCVADRIWSPSEVDLLRVAANTISAAIQRNLADNEIHKFNAALKQRVADLNTINQISQTLVYKRGLHELIHAVGEQIRIFYDSPVVYITLLDPRTNLIDFVYQYEGGRHCKGTQIKYGEGMTSRVMQSRQPILINTNWEQQASQYDVIREGAPSKSSLTVPLLLGDDAIGTISLQDMERENLYAEDHVRQLTTIAANLAVAIENARLHVTLEQRVQERTALLESANRELETFSYSVSHDLRAPLRAVRSFSDLLLRDYMSTFDADGRSLLERVIHAASEMNEKIDGLLAFARLTRAGLHPTNLDLSKLATEALEALNIAHPERQVTYHVEAGLHAKGDEVLTRTVLENLLGNAWKYTSKNPQPVIEFGLLHGNESAPTFFVRDNGAGFNMKYANKLFGAFQRLHRVDEFPGHGIGLATVQRIILRHGGRIWAEAEEGKGATFYFTLG